MHHWTDPGPALSVYESPWTATAVAIRPARPDDVQPLLDMHRRLSTKSLFMRYLVPYAPARLAAHLQDICAQPCEQGAALVAEQGSQVVGLGYYVVEPGRPNTAEPALLIEDRYQGRGIGRQLLGRLITVARHRGLRCFNALTHPDNRPMLHLLHDSGRRVSSRFDGGLVAVQLALAESA